MKLSLEWSMYNHTKDSQKSPHIQTPPVYNGVWALLEMVTNSFEYKNFMQSPRRLKMHLEGLRFLSFKFFSRGKMGRGGGIFILFWVLGVFPMYCHQVPKGFPNCSLRCSQHDLIKAHTIQKKIIKGKY